MRQVVGGGFDAVSGFIDRIIHPYDAKKHAEIFAGRLGELVDTENEALLRRLGNIDSDLTLSAHNTIM